MVKGDTYLSHKGYAIQKNGNEELIKELITELTVKPKNNAMINNDDVDTSFPVYRENKQKLYLPKSYGLSKFGIPTINTLSDGDDCPNLIFDGTLRDVQQTPVNEYINAVNNNKKMGGILSLPCGFGKCLGINTPILMYDGTIKMVQDVKIGDLLMGDDSTPRNVLSTCTGTEEMFDIIPTRGDKYTVNRSHILSLKCNQGNVIDISVDDYLQLPKSKVLYGYRVGVDFPTKNVPIDPYLFGYQLNDTNTNIPHIYKCNSRESRLQLLAGLIDSNGILLNDCFQITLKSKTLFDDIIYLARSLGFATDEKHHIIYISGNDIDKIPTKVIQKNNIIINSKDALITHITPKSIGIGTYYGFEIDGNRRFLLGDFTVTHNTVCALYLASYFKKKTLIVCHTDFLIEQWIERIQQYIPLASVGKIKQKKCDTVNKDIVIASLQSISMREYDNDIFKQFGFVVCDECHHLSAKVFSRCLPKITNKRMLGLSATLKRKDGLSKVFEWYIGKPVYEIKRKDSEVDILIKRYYDPHTAYSKICKLWNDPKKLNYAKMINNICAFSPRNYMIIDTLKDILKKEPNRKVLILSERRNHLQDLETILELNKFTSIGYYIGGMNKEKLDEGSTADIILATFQLASEAMDIPKLNTLILASPISSIEQPIGRIQRKKKEDREYTPLVVDIFDEFSIFEKLGYKRLNFYKKNEYNITDPAKDVRDNLAKQVKYTIIVDDDDNDDTK